MQLPILSGIYTDEAAQVRTAYPRNLIPVPKKSGISDGYLRHTDGIIKSGDGVGIDRGGINWLGTLYRVMGTKLVSITSGGTSTVVGDVGAGGQVTFGYSFDYLAVSSGGRFYLYNGASLAQVTDADLGTVIDFVWIDGYFLTTDGTSLVVTELNDPFSVNPLKYGSSESNPDPILSVKKVRNELAALNRHTIEFFDNVGGEFFPFSRIEGAQINKGTIGTFSNCVVNDLIAFMGGGFNEALSCYIGINGQVEKIATSEIDQRIAEYTEAQLALTVCEYKIYNGHIHIMFHLPDLTLVYDLSASKAVGEHIWYTMDSAIPSGTQYKGKNHVYCYDRWNVADPSSIQFGYLDDTISTHYGEKIGWEFSTQIVYNEGTGAIFHSLELVGTTGRVALGVTPTISTQYSLDGLTWSQEKFISAGTIGDTTKRLVWFLQGSMKHWRIQKFKGTSDAMISVSRLEAKLEPLYV